jgi:hypothetical protein
MNWFRQNRFLGTFLVGLGLATLLGLWFLFHEKAAADAAQARLEETVNELSRLRRSTPFPDAENLKKTKAQAENYRASLLSLETELKGRMFPRLPLQPNEFQAQLRLAVNDVLDHAATAKVQLPANFNLGFDPYATSLPNLEAAPRLGRQLRAIEWIANTIIDAHVDSLGSLTRELLPEEKSAPEATPAPGRTLRQTKPAPGKEKVVDSAAIDLTFSGSPTAVRRVINQIAAAKDQFYIIRTLVVKNQVDKGPKRGGSEGAAPAPTPAVGGKEPAIKFIVGTEHLDVAARIEIMRFNFLAKQTR